MSPGCRRQAVRPYPAPPARGLHRIGNLPRLVNRPAVADAPSHSMTMNTVFLSGSRGISRLDAAVRGRLRRIVERGLRVVVGDAQGADSAMQSYLHTQGYGKVVVYCVGSRCRNNVGSWPIHSVLADPAHRGRAPYTLRDKAMAAVADYGLVLWDGKSKGSFSNILELLKHGKSTVVYLAPHKQCITIKTSEDAKALLQSCTPANTRSNPQLIGHPPEISFLKKGAASWT